MNIRYFNGPSDWEWVRERVGLLRVEDTCGLVVTDDHDKQIAAAIFDNFLHNSAQVTLILDNPMVIRHGFLDVAFDFLFNQCGKNFCYALVPENNVRSNRLTQRVGFKEKMRIPEGFGPQVDFIVYELSRYYWFRNQVEMKEAA